MMNLEDIGGLCLIVVWDEEVLMLYRVQLKFLSMLLSHEIRQLGLIVYPTYYLHVFRLLFRYFLL